MLILKEYKIRKRAQIWIESVLYTLIGIAIMGIALGFIMPEINESKDRALIEQSIESLKYFDDRVESAIDFGPGNIRQIELIMKKGELYIDSVNDDIYIMIYDMSSKYSEIDEEIKLGDKIRLKSSEGLKGYDMKIWLNYSGRINMSYSEDYGAVEKFSGAPTPYRFVIENKGDSDEDGLTEVDISESL